MDEKLRAKKAAQKWSQISNFFSPLDSNKKDSQSPNLNLSNAESGGAGGASKENGNSSRRRPAPKAQSIFVQPFAFKQMSSIKKVGNYQSFNNQDSILNSEERALKGFQKKDKRQPLRATALQIENIIQQSKIFPQKAGHRINHSLNLSNNRIENQQVNNSYVEPSQGCGEQV